MYFEPNLEINQIINKLELINVFKCSSVGRMKGSYKTNSLVLIADHTKNDYDKLWINESNIIYYQGMGKSDVQTLNYYQNKTLNNSNINGINVFLFKNLREDEFTFMGRVILLPLNHNAQKLTGLPVRRLTNIMTVS